MPSTIFCSCRVGFLSDNLVRIAEAQILNQRHLMPCRLGAIVLAIAMSTAQPGCNVPSRLDSRAALPAGVRHRPSSYWGFGRASAPLRNVASNQPNVPLPSAPMVARQPRTSPLGNGPEIIATPRPDGASTVGPLGPTEIVATPRPNAPAVPPSAMNAGPPLPAPAAMPPAPPSPRPWRKWRGFLPAHGTDEDRPGWWTPDYGGGTSA